MNIGQLLIGLGVDTKDLDQAIGRVEVFARKAKASAMVAGAAIDQTSKELEAFGNKAVRTAEMNATSTINHLQRVGGMMYTFGIRYSMYVTAPMVALGAASFKAAKDFEAAMYKIEGLVGESREQVKAWSGELLNMSPKLGRPPKELAEGLYFVTSSGFSGAEAMDILNQSARAATAGLGETAAVADLVTSAMNAYRKEGLTATTTVDALTAAVREGKTEAGAFAKEVGQVIPVAAYLGVSFQEVAAAMAAMSLTGTNAAEASVYLRGILNALLDPAPQAAEALAMMGTSAEELRAIMSQDFMAALKKISDLTKQYGMSLVSQVIPNVRAMTGFLSLMGDNYEQNIKIFEEVQNSLGATDKAYQTATDTLEHKWNEAVNSSRTSMIKFILAMKEQLVPILEGIGGFLKGIGDSFDALSPSVQRMVGTTVALVAALGPLSLALSFLYKFVLPGLIIMTNGLTASWSAFTVALLANPIGVLAVAIGTFAGYTLVKLIDKLNEATEAKMQFDNAMRNRAFGTGDEPEFAVQAVNDLAERMKALKTLDNPALTTLKKDILEQMKIEQQALDYGKIVAQKRLLDFQRFGTAFSMEERNQLAESIRSRRNHITLLNIYAKQVDGAMKGIVTAETSKSISDIMDEMYKQLAALELMAKVIGPSFDLAGKKIQLFEATLAKLAEIGPGAESTMQKVNRMLKAISTIKPIKFSVDVQAIMNELNAELGRVELSKGILGTAFDADKESLDAYERAMDDIIKKMNEMKQQATKMVAEVGFKFITGDITAQEVITYGAQIQELSKGAKAAAMALKEVQTGVDLVTASASRAEGAGIMQSLMDEMAFIARMEDIRGSAYDEAAAGVGAYADALERLLRMEKLQPELIKEVSAALLEYSEKQRLANQTLMVNNIVANASAEVLSGLGAAIVSTGDAWMDLARTILKTVQQIISALLVENIALLINDGIKKKGIFGLAIAAVSIGAMMALFEGASGKAKGAAKLAGGGVIPAGYPNDTFPALLSSGEEVLPAKDRKKDMDVTIQMAMGGKTHAREFYWMLENYKVFLNETVGK